MSNNRDKTPSNVAMEAHRAVPTAEAAAALKISETLLADYARQGAPHRKMGKGRPSLWDPPEVWAWMRSEGLNGKPGRPEEFVHKIPLRLHRFPLPPKPNRERIRAGDVLGGRVVGALMDSPPLIYAIEKAVLAGELVMTPEQTQAYVLASVSRRSLESGTCNEEYQMFAGLSGWNLRVALNDDFMIACEIFEKDIATITEPPREIEVDEEGNALGDDDNDAIHHVREFNKKKGKGAGK